MERQTFEIGLYNAEVRACLKQGERHRFLADGWADIHYIEVSARDVDDARARIQRRYPARNGYVIEDIREVV